MFRKISDIKTSYAELVTEGNREWFLYKAYDYLLDTDKGLFVTEKPLTYFEVEKYLKNIQFESVNVYEIRIKESKISEMPDDYNSTKEITPEFDELDIVEETQDTTEETEEVIESTEDVTEEPQKDSNAPTEVPLKDFVDDSETKSYYLLSNRKTGVKSSWKGWSTVQMDPTSAKPFVWKYKEDAKGNKSDPAIYTSFNKSKEDSE